MTETCEDDLPHLITHIETAPGPAADGAATPKIHEALEQWSLLPSTHIVDTGFLDAELLVESHTHYDVDLLGPTRLDYHWQAQAGAGFDAQHFQIDGDQQRATCPAGKTRIRWTPALDNRENPVIKVKFSTKDCRRCDHVTQCIRSKKRYPRRTLTIRPQPQYLALQAARQREATEAFQAEYARRDRGHHLARYTGYASATHPLYRAGTGPFGPYPDGGGAERAAAWRVVLGDCACQDPDHAIRPADGG